MLGNIGWKRSARDFGASSLFPTELTLLLDVIYDAK
jgi:hypothetical protein